MRAKTGIDIVYLPRFKKIAKNGGQKFLQRVFLTEELKDTRIAHLAGIFAAKEAVMKAFDLPKNSWQNIQINHKKSGMPQVKFPTSRLPLLTSSLSIAHDGNYVIAQFVALLK